MIRMILVTGITGLTGNFLYKEIKKTELNVRFLVRPTSNIAFMEESDDIKIGDLKNVETINAAMKGITSVLHLAPRSELQNVVDACIQNNIKRVFFVSSTGIYSKFKSSSHIDIKNEEYLKKSGLIFTIIRPTMIYGNSQDGNIKMLVKLMNKTPIFPVIGQGNGLMHPVYAKDLAIFIASNLVNEELTRFKEYNVAGKHSIKYKDLLNNISKALGKKVVLLHIPYSLALLAGKIGDKIKNPLIDYEKVLRIEEDKNFDYSIAVNDLNYAPISFDEGIVHEVEALRKSKYI